MLSSGEIAKIKADIARLEKARTECADGGIRRLIEAWIEELKNRSIPTGSQRTRTLT
jgi:hypothetical protein